MMTLIEVLRHAQNSGDRCLFTLYYEALSNGKAALTPSEIREALGRCRVKGYKSINISNVLSRANHLVDRSKDHGSAHKWHLTPSGIEYVKSQLLSCFGSLPEIGKPRMLHSKTISILFLGLAPMDADRIRIDKETREIETKLRACEHRDAFKFQSKWAVRTKDLFQHIHETNPDILHISGHGSKNGEIAFEDDHGNTKLVNASTLSNAISGIDTKIRIALFNLCYSGLAAKKLVEHLECSIGMSGPINDESAIEFASSFYRSLGFGKKVTQAFREARASLVLEGLPGDHLLELNVKTGVDPAQLDLMH